MKNQKIKKILIIIRILEKNLNQRKKNKKLKIKKLKSPRKKV